MEDMPRIFEEYDRLAEMFYERRKNGRWFNFFHFMVDLADGPCAAKRMSGCGCGNEYITVTPQGDIYPCHQFVGKKEFAVMGSVLPANWTPTCRPVSGIPTCRPRKNGCRCWAKYYRSGGCAANAYNFSGDIKKPYEPACVMERNGWSALLRCTPKSRRTGSGRN